MSFDVDVAKRMTSGERTFDLQVRFTARAKRTVIYGPSGAGKSLTLQALAGLQTPDAGRIAFDGDVLFDATARIDVPARARGFGYLFQDYALFPKLTVRQNVAFGLSGGLANPSTRSDAEPVRRWLAAFELDDVADQEPRALSGGQRQRVALARALVNGPRALLLDEPFSALDPDLRGRMRAELDRLLADVDLPMVMITHDREDLARFGDEAFYIEDGRIVAAPGRAPVPWSPSMKTSARNQFEGTVASIREGAIDDEIDLDVGGGVRIVATVTRESRDALGLKVGATAFGLVKASSIIVVTEADDVRLSARNQIPGRIVRVVPGAINTEVVLDVPGTAGIVAVVTNDSATHLALAPGVAATAIFKAGSVVVGVRRG